MKHTLPDGLQLYYEIHGQANADKSIVFLNGLSQSTAAWAGLLPLAHEYQIVLVDLIFQGKSDAAPVFRDFDQHAADVAGLLSALQLKDATITGISYGGAVAQRVLVNHPQLVQRGILLSSFSKKDAYFDAIGESWKTALGFGGYNLMLEIMLPIVLGKSYFLNPVIPIEVLKNAKSIESPATGNLLKLMEATEKSGNYLPELKKVKMPVLVIHGEEDILCTPEMGKEISKALPRGSFLEFAKVGHTLNLEAIPQLTKEIKRFLASA